MTEDELQTRVIEILLIPSVKENGSTEEAYAAITKKIVRQVKEAVDNALEHL